jgi:hypothetical protein
MLKYTLGALAVIAAIVLAAFTALDRLNNRGAEAGPAAVYEITATDDAISPDRLDLEAGRVVELRLINRATRERALTLKSNDVEQLPATVDGQSQRGATEPLPDIDVSVPANASGFALVRFKKSGTYELGIGAPSRPNTLRILTIDVN